MQIQLASRPSSNSAEACFALATTNVVVVLDGISVPPGVETGCVHDSVWYVRRLGGALVDTLLNDTRPALVDSLAQAIANVNAWHINACNLMLPSPSSAVAILREQEETIDFLLIGDITILLDEPGGVRVITDRQLHHVAGAEQAGHQQPTNPTVIGGRYVATPGLNRCGDQDGFCRVSSDPSDVDHAVIGTAHRPGVRRAALLNNGACRLADRFGLTGWSILLDLIDEGGPEALIYQPPEGGPPDSDKPGLPYIKPQGGAAAVVCRFR